MQDNALLSDLALAFISRDLNGEISLVKTIKEALQKIPTVEIIIIMKYHSIWFTFFWIYLLIFGGIVSLFYFDYKQTLSNHNMQVI